MSRGSRSTTSSFRVDTGRPSTIAHNRQHALFSNGSVMPIATPHLSWVGAWLRAAAAARTSRM
jgi:hypothetical protein